MRIGRIYWAPDYGLAGIERELVRTNPLGAETSLAVGKAYERGGTRYIITRHRTVPTVPWTTVIVYGVPA